MLNVTKSISISGTSEIEKKVVVSFSASIPSTGSISLNKSIMDKKTYLANKEECDSDYANFEAKVTSEFEEG